MAAGSPPPTRRALLAGLGAAALTARLRPAFAADDVVLSNARILVGDGTELTGGVRLRGGRFVEVGPGVTGGVDLGGGVLYPGLYESGSTLGLGEVGLEADTQDGAESSEAITPQARVVDGYNPMSEVVEVQRAGGVVAALVLPSSGNLVAGQAAWMRTLTQPGREGLALAAPAGVLFNLGHLATGATPGSPKSRMGVAMKIRDLLDANPPPPPEGDGKKARKGEAPPAPVTGLQRVVHDVRARRTKALFTAQRADDLLLAVELARQYELDAVLVGAAEGHLVARELAAAGYPVLVGPVTEQPDSFQTLHAAYENAARLHAAGVRFALRIGDPHRTKDLTTEAGIAVAYGLPFAAAIAAITGNGPGFWGLDTGLVRVGHRATCVWTDGDPLQPRTSVRGVWMEGVSMPLTSRQTRAFERFRELK